LYVVKCGGERNRVKGWKASRRSSGDWAYYTEQGKRFESRAAAVRWLKLPGAPAVGHANPVRPRTNIASSKECKDALERLASYVVECGGKRSRVKGWKASRMPSGFWCYYTVKGRNRFDTRPAVARWLKLPGAPAVGQANRGPARTNIASVKECKDALERLASYVVERGGSRNRVKGWEASRNTSRIWSYHTEKGKRFDGRPAVARHFNLLSTPAVQTRSKRKR
jgi:hypothetical protein